MTDHTSVGNRLQYLEVGPEFDTYTRVIVHVGQITDASGNTKDLDYVAGNTTGRTLEVTDPNGTQAKANAMLARLQNSKWQYRPGQMQSALLDPAAELGDGISAGDDFYTGIYKRDVTFSSLMAADIEAPSDEEIDHEFPYIPQADREYRREVQFTRSQIKISANAISAEVSRATTAEGQLSSRITVTVNAITSEVSRATSAEGVLRSSITQNANSISAEVSRATTAEGTKLNHTTVNSTFGWKLTADGFYINKSGNQNVFTCTKDGIVIQGNATVTGKIQATSGYIGSSNNGFTITSNAIYNGKTGISDANNGVYIGKDGIALGANSAFKVTNTGAVTAKNLTINGGSISIGRDGNNNVMFYVSPSGSVTARDLRLTNGLSIGSNFTVNQNGNVTANNMVLRGTLTMQNSSGGNSKYISADTLAQYAFNSNEWLTTPQSAYGGYSAAAYSVGGAGAGYSSAETWSAATDSNRGIPYLRVSNIYAANYLAADSLAVPWGAFSYGGNPIGGTTIKDGDGNYVAVLTF